MTSHDLTVAVFVGLGCLLVVLEAAARVPGSRVPTVNRLVNLALGRRSVQVLMVLAWWWIGWHFFADARP